MEDSNAAGQYKFTDPNQVFSAFKRKHPDWRKYVRTTPARWKAFDAYATNLAKRSPDAANGMLTGRYKKDVKPGGLINSVGRYLSKHFG